MLQPLYERYEFGALTIKLTAVVLMFTGVVVELHAAWLLLLIAVLWLQEGIFKTFQARLGARLLVIEQGIEAGAADAAFALHRPWQARRPGMFGLVREYLASALRPTVAFPYLVLLVLVWLFYS